MKLPFRNKNQLGFTLFELLITLAIIGVLAAVIMVSYQQSRIKARDAKRKDDIAAIRQALELYYHENGFYPRNGAVGPPNNETTVQNLSTFLVPTFVSAIPNDPRNNPDNYEYVWWQNGTAMGLYVPFGNDGGISCKILTQGGNSLWWGATPNCNY